MALSGSFGVNSRTGQTGDGIQFAAHLTVTVDYNLGFDGDEDDDRTFGGFSYTYNSSQSPDFYGNFSESVKNTTYGPMIHAGIRAFIGTRAYELKGSYSIGLEKFKFRTVGITLGTSF